MGLKFIRLAALYAIIGIGLGIHMAASHHFDQRDTHAHANLLGWVTMALFGLIYTAYPALEKHVLAKLHFWLYNLGLPITLFGVASIYAGNTGMGEPLAGIGSMLIAAGFLALVANLCRKDLKH